MKVNVHSNPIIFNHTIIFLSSFLSYEHWLYKSDGWTVARFNDLSKFADCHNLISPNIHIQSSLIEEQETWWDPLDFTEEAVWQRTGLTSDMICALAVYSLWRRVVSSNTRRTTHRSSRMQEINTFTRLTSVVHVKKSCKTGTDLKKQIVA